MSGHRYRQLNHQDLVALLTEEERELDFAEFTYGDAWDVVSWLRATALERGHAVAIAVEFGEQRVAHSALEGSSAANDAWLDRKFRVVRHFRRSSLGVRADYVANGMDFAADSALDPQLYVAAGGAFPLRVNGSVIGALGVSGLEMHDDHALVVEALRAQYAR